MSNPIKSTVVLPALLMAVLVGAPVAYGWDATGHRLIADLAFVQIDEELRGQLYRILREHPRFQEDFMDSMPASVGQGPPWERQQWLLGRAAYWPDMARGLPDGEREKYNHPDWHYIDGRLVRERTVSNGNVYLEFPPEETVSMLARIGADRESRVTNVITALDYNTRLYTDPATEPAARAIALCWVLHLMGDVHQPLHAGALFSVALFPGGDRGGNGIPTDDGTLHARWDSALSSEPYQVNWQRLTANFEQVTGGNYYARDLDWTRWLQESRELVAGSAVYSLAIRRLILDAESSVRPLQPIELDSDYVDNMQRIARERVALAGYRLALWLYANTERR